MDWFTHNLIETLLVIGVALLIIEVAVLGFSTFFLFFAGLAALVTSILMWLGILPETALTSLIAIAALTALFAAVLWKPLSKMQTQVDHTRPKSDLVGYQFVLPDDLSGDSSCKVTYEYSGIVWQLVSTETIAKSSLVEIVQVDVGQLNVKAVND